MHQLAIMQKSLGFIPKILSGQKTIESRWYKFKRAPWDKVSVADTLYFKNSGEPVTVSANVQKVMQFENLNPERVEQIFREYSRAIGIEQRDMKKFYEMYKDKKYCILMFLENPKQIEPFEINKKGFGAMSAWVSVDDIERIKVQ